MFALLGAVAAFIFILVKAQVLSQALLSAVKTSRQFCLTAHLKAEESAILAVQIMQILQTFGCMLSVNCTVYCMEAAN